MSPSPLNFLFRAGQWEFAAFPFAPVTPTQYISQSPEPASMMNETEPFPAFDPSLTAEKYEYEILITNTIPIRSAITSANLQTQQSTLQTISERSTSNLIPSVAAFARPLLADAIIDRLDFGPDLNVLRTQKAILNYQAPLSDYSTIVFPGFPALPHPPSPPLRSPADFGFPKLRVRLQSSRGPSNLTRSIARPFLPGGRVIVGRWYEQPDGRLRRLSSVGSLIPYLVQPNPASPLFTQAQPLTSRWSDSSSSYVTTIYSPTLPVRLGFLPSPSPSISSLSSTLSYFEALYRGNPPQTEGNSSSSSSFLSSPLSLSTFQFLPGPTSPPLVSPLSPSSEDLVLNSPVSPLATFSFSTGASDRFDVKQRGASFSQMSIVRSPPLSRSEPQSSVGSAGRFRKLWRSSRVLLRVALQKVR